MPRPTQCSGFTAVELAIAMAILPLLLAGVVTIRQRSVALFEQTLANDRVDAATTRTTSAGSS